MVVRGLSCAAIVCTRPGIFKCATRIEVSSDAGRTKYVATELPVQASFRRAPADHRVGIHMVHRPVRQSPGSAGGGAEEGDLVLITDAGRGQVFIKEMLELMVGRHLVPLAAFLVQPTHQRLPLAK